MHGGILINETREGAPVIENERQQRMVERIQEDERLRGDLPDDAAAALVEWAGKRVAAAAADAARPDAAVEAEVQAIRAAARAAARSGESDPPHLLALAEAKLAQRPASGSPLVAMQPTASSVNLAAGVGASSAVGAGAARSQPPNPSAPPSELTAGTTQTSAPSKAEQPQPEHKRPSPRRWNPFAGFLKHIRGDR
jgi:hypothetical protein